jgi:fumarylacetoacetase
MMTFVDATHNPQLQSWVASANTADTDFPIQNLPYGRFQLAADQQADSAWRIGVAIGDHVLDLHATGLIAFNDMQQLLQLDKPARVALRKALSEGLTQGSALEAAWRPHLHHLNDVLLGLPCDTRDYSDFYVGIHHATAVGKLFRPDNPLLPNYKWMPIAYHGRASTLQVSGKSFVRPTGQIKAADADAPVLSPSQRLDLELELGIVVGRPNPQGQPIGIEEAEDHVFGITLFNDWSARDFQAWEYQPLGPFLSKNFASTLSPWIITLEALAPFRLPFARPEGDPQPLPYLDSASNRAQGALDIDLEVLIQTDKMRQAGEAPVCISRSNFAQAAYWTVAQMVAHHTVNGCSLSAGDLFGSGTLSGPTIDQSGSLLELSQGGKQAICLPNGEQRTFLLDGDSITLKGRCARQGARSIGFGLCEGTVVPVTTQSKN